MNRFVSTLPMLAVLSLSPLTLSAQNTAPAFVPQVTPIFYAESAVPAMFSTSSSVNDFKASLASGASAAAGQVVNKPDSVRPFSAVGVGFKIGSTGIGFDVATPLVKRLNLRGGAGFFSYTYNGTIDNDPISAKLKLNNGDIVADLFPFNGSFRLSAGITIKNQAGLNGTLTTTGGQQVTVGNNVYTSSTAKPLTGTLGVGFGGSVVPRFTLGWGNMVSPKGHIKFETEFGIEATGTPTVAWNYAGNACAGSVSSCTTTTGTVATADVAAQNASLQSDVNGVKVFPIFSFGLSYKIGHSH